jgi:streptomycin 6-kinase
MTSKLYPLELQIFGQGPARLLGADGFAVATIYLTEYRKKVREPERLALARAIAEAPAMLEALRDVTECLANWIEIADDEDQRGEDHQALSNARAILARIDGEAAQ